MSRRAGWIGLAALIALAGCHRAPGPDGKPDERPQEKPVQTPEERPVQTPAPSPAHDAADDAAILKLFDEAEACGNRYDCPPLAALQTRAERPGELAVLRVAFDLMADPKLETHERRFKMASATARAWAAARTTEGKTLSADDEAALRAQVMRLLARPDNAVPAHGFVEYLPDARAIFEREALDPRRGNEEVHSAIRGLRDREPDLTTVKVWLGATEERPQVAGALLLDAFDHGKLQPGDEVAMLLGFAGRKDTAPEAARLVARHAVDHADPAFAPVVKAFGQHPDPAVRKAASEPPAK